MLFTRIACVALCALVLLPVSAAAQRQSSKTAPRPDQVRIDRSMLEKFRQAERDPRRGVLKERVIIQYRSGARVNLRTSATRAGGRVRRDDPRSGAIAVEISLKALMDMRANPDVLGISQDAIVRAGNTETEDSAPPVYDVQAVRQTLGIVRADTASSVGVAIVDSGIHPSLDLEGRISAFYDFTSGAATASAPSDGYGHGTHIAGLIAGSGAMSKGQYMGVATGARLIGLKVLNDQGAGYASDVIAAIDFAAANRVALGIDVMNLSLGHPIYEAAATDPLVLAVERAAAAGIVVVVSAGNWGLNPVTGEIGYAGITSPGNAPSAITVGSLRTKATATRLDDEVSAFSSRGPTWYDGFVKPDVLAPGQALIAISHAGAALYQNRALHAPVAPYLRLSGTSMAAGVASGVAALILEANRADEGSSLPLSPNLVKAIMQFTAIPLADADPSTPLQLEQGTGGLNARGAIELSAAIDPSMPVNAWWMETALEPTTFLVDSSLPWSQSVIWGHRVVTGDTVRYNQPAWSLIYALDDDGHIVWGDAEDGHIVWGDDDDGHIVWGDSILEGANLTAESFSAWSTQIVFGNSLVYGQNDDGHIVWGDDDEHIVWGDSADEHIVWGDLDDEHIVWGDNDEHIVWGDDDEHLVWGDSIVGAVRH